jgi:hypothetical protein
MKISERLRELVRRFIQEIEFYKRVLRHPHTPLISKLLLGLAIILIPKSVIIDCRQSKEL